MKKRFIFFVLLIPWCAVFAQKESLVKNYLGDHSGKIPANGVMVIFRFKEGGLQRVGDGKSNFIHLLKSQAGYNDAGGGNLMDITYGGKHYPTADERRSGTTTNVSSQNSESIDDMRKRMILEEEKRQIADSIAQAGRFRKKEREAQALLDSANLFEKTANLSREANEKIDRANAILEDGWDKAYRICIKTLIWISGIWMFFYFIARSIQNESGIAWVAGLPWIGPSTKSFFLVSSGICLICTWAIVGFLLINIFLFIVKTVQAETWMGLIVVAGLGWLAAHFSAKISDKMVPNLRILNAPKSDGGATANAQNQQKK